MFKANTESKGLEKVQILGFFSVLQSFLHGLLMVPLGFQSFFSSVITVINKVLQEYS